MVGCVVTLVATLGLPATPGWAQPGETSEGLGAPQARDVAPAPPPIPPGASPASARYRWEVTQGADGTTFGQWVMDTAPSRGAALRSFTAVEVHPYVPQYNSGFRAEWGGFGGEDRSYLRLRNRVWGELGLYRGTLPFAGSGRAVTLATATLAAQLRPSDPFRIDLSWPVGFAVVGDAALTGDSTGNAGSVFSGNPSVSAAYVTATRRSEIRVGGTLAFPLANPGAAATDDDLGRLLLDRAAAMGGATQVWWWRPSSISLVFQSALDYEEDFLAGTNVSLGTMVDVKSGDADFVFVTGGYLGFRVAQLFKVGLDVSAAVLAADRVQLSSGPYVELDGDLYLRLGLRMNLNRPAGFAFSNGGVWAVQLAGGWQFR